jgi:hypothetical protein
MKPKSNKELWWTTRILSGLIIAFSIFMFIGYRLRPESGEPSPLNTSDMIGFSLVGTGFIGLLSALKWELIGGIISLIAFFGSAIIFPLILIPSPMYIWPVTAALFIVLWKRNKTAALKNQ